MKTHYFIEGKPDHDDLRLMRARNEGWVPPGCLLGGGTIELLRPTIEFSDELTACDNCFCDRNKCNGLPRNVVDPVTEASRAHIRALLEGDTKNWTDVFTKGRWV